LQLVHIPKTGGTTLEAFSAYAHTRLGPSMPLWGKHNKRLANGTSCMHLNTRLATPLPKACFAPMPGGDFCAVWGAPPHAIPQARAVHMRLGVETFCVVRHPSERIVSAFRDFVDDKRDFRTALVGPKLRGLRRGGCTAARLNEYVQQHRQNVEAGHRYIEWCHLTPQSEYVQAGWCRHQLRSARHRRAPLAPPSRPTPAPTHDPSNWHTPKNEREYLRSPQKARDKLSELVLRVSECVEAVSEWCRRVSIDTSVGVCR
jgi:hypothetical protein